MQFDVPMDGQWINGRHDGPDFITRHFKCVQDLDRTRFLIGIDVLRPHPSVPIRPDVRIAALSRALDKALSFRFAEPISGQPLREGGTQQHDGSDEPREGVRHPL